MEGREEEPEADEVKGSAGTAGEGPAVVKEEKMESDDGVEGEKDGADTDGPVMTWIQCDKPMCRKWRRIETKIAESIQDDDKW